MTLLGVDDSDDTVAPPEGVPTPSRWFARYLNARYFDFPEGVEVRAREGWQHDRDDKNRNITARACAACVGFLTSTPTQNGVVELTECRVHWWILDDSEKRKKTSELPNTGHFATLYQGETVRDDHRPRGHGATAAVRRALRHRPCCGLRRAA